MQQLLLVAGALGCAGFVVTFLVDGATRPGYSVRRHPVSALALGSRGWLQTANFVVGGVLVTGGGVGLLLAAGGTGERIVAIAVAVIGVALVASGVFAMDPMRGYPPGAPDGDPPSYTRHHQWHDHAGLVVFAGLPLTMIAHAVVYDDLAVRIASGLLGIVAVVLSGWFGSAWERDDLRTGVVQRAFLVVTMGWVCWILVLTGTPA